MRGDRDRPVPAAGDGAWKQSRGRETAKAEVSVHLQWLDRN